MKRKHKPVISRLQVGVVGNVGHETSGAKVDDLDTKWPLHGIYEHDVLGLEVRVDQTQGLQLGQGNQYLKGDVCGCVEEHEYVSSPLMNIRRPMNYAKHEKPQRP